ncbi:MAG: polymer-forming cytoskeletal protein [Acidobacteria bacterium]|nr:polymer-forming cytoskeletal protein [Acidobacteriota bacterium]
MWKKNEEASQPGPPVPTSAARLQALEKASVIGPSIRIKGNLTGKEDLVIQGQLQGEVRLQANNVTVGKEGRIRADIYGRTVHIEGEVKGHLFAEQEVIIRASGKVQGNIVSPRVVLEKGSNFKGSIDMEPAAAKAPEASKEAPKEKPKEAPKQAKNSARATVTDPAGAPQPAHPIGSDPPANTKGDAQKSAASVPAPAPGNRP